jgi:hypothetical protein
MRYLLTVRFTDDGNQAPPIDVTWWLYLIRGA